MADLPDYYTQTQISEAEAAKFKGGLDANKSATPVSRDIYLATDTQILYVCIVDGAWTGFDASILIQGILTLYANLAGGGYKITNLADPTAAQDAATRAYVLARCGLYLPLTGGTMTGAIAMGGSKVTGLGSPTAQDNALRYGRAEIRNAEIAAAAAIVYSKLNLALGIVNADVNAAAAIVYSKLNLALGIVNADVNAAAAILESKLALNYATHAKYLDAEAVAAVEAAGLTLAAAKHILFADDGYIQLGVAAGSPRLSVEVVGAVSAVIFKPKDGNYYGLVNIRPSGTQNISYLELDNTSDPDNTGYAQLSIGSSQLFVGGGKTGTGTAPTHFVMLLPIDMAGEKLEGLPTPSASDEAASKGYTDSLVAAGTGSVVTITFIIDGGGEAITTGQKGHLRIPFACTINRVTMLAGQSGSIVVDIWKDTYANFPPADGDSITAAAVPTISTAQKSEDSTLSGWTTAIATDDILAYNVDSCTDIERVTISLKVTKA